jgi:hypothetical protein
VGNPGAHQRRPEAGKPPFRYLSRLRRADGSYRYSVRYGTTPVWVTAQVVPALAGRPVPAALIDRGWRQRRLGRVSSKVGDERAPQRARDRSEARPAWGRPPVGCRGRGLLLAAVVGMTSAASPWMARRRQRVVAAADVG